MGPDGIEPSTSPLSGVRSSHLSYGPRCFANTGGAGRDRTGDLLSANQALSQLSYSPFSGQAPLLQGRPAFEILIEASWIQGPGISNPQPLSDSLPYALSGDPVACSLSPPKAPEGFPWNNDNGLWNGTTAPYSSTLYTQALLTFRNSIHGLS